MDAILGVLLRWVHISSVVILIGGVFYARFFAESLSPRFRPWMWGTMIALLASGLYNLLSKEPLPVGYHIWFGIKMLFVLHIFAVGIIVSTAPADKPKPARMLTGIAYSGLTVFLISAWLRWLSIR